VQLIHGSPEAARRNGSSHLALPMPLWLTAISASVARMSAATSGIVVYPRISLCSRRLLAATLKWSFQLWHDWLLVLDQVVPHQVAR